MPPRIRNTAEIARAAQKEEIESRKPRREAGRDFVRQREKLAGQTGLGDSAPKTARELASRSIRENDPREIAAKSAELEAARAAVEAQILASNLEKRKIEQAANLIPNEQIGVVPDNNTIQPTLEQATATGQVIPLPDVNPEVAQEQQRTQVLANAAGLAGGTLAGGVVGGSVATAVSASSLTAATAANALKSNKLLAGSLGGTAIFLARNKAGDAQTSAKNSEKSIRKWTNYVANGGDPAVAREQYNKEWENIVKDQQTLKRISQTVVGDILADSGSKLDTVSQFIDDKETYDLKFNQAVLQPTGADVYTFREDEQ